ncbi:MAG: gas vesicle protein GvpN [Planctomycetes bacterium]|nr:gas vesicle protein GvpN [Planctomycetota bacterium]
MRIATPIPTALCLKPRSGFVATTQVKEITERALLYLRAGYAVHFSGPAGTGKTTLAMHVAASFGRQVVLIHGDDEFATSDLVGENCGYHRSRLVDNYVHSVMRTEDRLQREWVDNRLTNAVKHGFTLVYDEFTRSRPEANNVLLGVLEERVLDLPRGRWEEPYLRVHPEFGAIFTSNPDEYAGVHRTQDALLDRMITIRLDEVDRDCEVEIVAARSGIPENDAKKIVDLVIAFRELGVRNHRPTIRASLMLSRLVRMSGARPEASDRRFVEIAKDVLSGDTLKVTRDGRSVGGEVVEELVRRVCGP